MPLPEAPVARGLAALLLAAALIAAPAAAAKDKKKEASARAPTKHLSASGRSNIVLAQAYLEAGKLDVAIKSARAALDSDPGSALAHATMAMVHSKRKDHRQAQAAFAKAMAIAPRDGPILNAYGAWLCETGKPEPADEAFRRALQDPAYGAPAQALFNAGRCALYDKNLVRSEGYLRRALVMAPRNRAVLLMLAQIQLQLGRPLDARGFVQRADALGAEPQTLALAARVEEQAGDAGAAARYRARLHTEFPNFAPAAEGPSKP